MSWLNQSGVIVLGDIEGMEHLKVSIEANDEAVRWLEGIPVDQQAAIFAEVSRALCTAGLDIKRVLVRALKEARDVPA